MLHCQCPGYIHWLLLNSTFSNLCQTKGDWNGKMSFNYNFMIINTMSSTKNIANINTSLYFVFYDGRLTLSHLCSLNINPNHTICSGTCTHCFRGISQSSEMFFITRCHNFSWIAIRAVEDVTNLKTYMVRIAANNLKRKFLKNISIKSWSPRCWLLKVSLFCHHFHKWPWTYLNSCSLDHLQSCHFFHHTGFRNVKIKSNPQSTRLSFTK